MCHALPTCVILTRRTHTCTGVPFAAATWIFVSRRSSCEVVMLVQTSASFRARTTWIIL